MKKWQYWLAYAIYFGLVSLANWQWRWALIYWCLGGALGMSFEYADRWVTEYLIKPEGRARLNSESALFMMGWLALSVYVMTSTGSVIAMGLVMGIGLKFLLGLPGVWKHPGEIYGKYFWQIKRPLREMEMKAVLGIIAAGFAWLTLVVINL